MELVYLFHSGFALLAPDITLVFDFYEDTQGVDKGVLHDELLSRPGAFYVFSTHFHADHFNPGILEWQAVRPDIRYIFSSDIRKHRKPEIPVAAWLHKDETYADEQIRVRAFGSTDIGISLSVELDGKRIFHAGDLNNWHWMDECEEKEWRSYERAFLSELQHLRLHAPAFDLVMFPVDSRLGSAYMRGPQQFVEQIRTGLFVPMHFDAEHEKAMAFEPIAKANGSDFLCLYKRGDRSVIF